MKKPSILLAILVTTVFLTGLSVSVLASQSLGDINLEHSEKWYYLNNTYVLDVAADDVDNDRVKEIFTVGSYRTGEQFYGSWICHGQIKIWNWNGTSLSLENTKNWNSDYLSATGWRGIEGVAIGDVDGDGVKEIVTTGYRCDFKQLPVVYKGELAIWNWNGTALTLERVETWYYEGIQYSFDLWLDDVDNDGKEEIMTVGYIWRPSESTRHGELRIWNWNGTVLTVEKSQEWSTATEDVWAYSVCSEDVDQDGVVEIVTGGCKKKSGSCNSQIRIWNWNGTTLTLEHNEEWGTFATGQGALIYGVAAKDLNNDNKPEIISSGISNYDGVTNYTAQIRIWNWNGTVLTSLQNKEYYSPSNSAAFSNGVTTADVNADGIVELINTGFVMNGSYWQGHLRTWQWNGTSLTAKNEESYGQDTRGSEVFVSDVDGDHIQEIITCGIVHDGTRYNGQLGIWSLPDLTPPVADAGSDQTVEEGTLVKFNGSASWDYSYIVSYKWTFVDGTPKTLMGVTPNYTFATLGVYTVTLNVTDAAGNWDTHQVSITVKDVTKPVVDAGPDQTVNEDTVVILDGSNSSDNVGITSYTWKFTDGTPRTLIGAKPNYTFENPGTYVVTLNVTDVAGNYKTDTITVTVKDVTQPTADAGADKAAQAGAQVSFDASGSSDNVGVVSYEWNFGDGTTGTGKTVTHVYAAAGTYTVTLTVKDAAGNSRTDFLMVTVTEFPWAMVVIAGALIAALAAVVLLLIRRRP